MRGFTVYTQRAILLHFSPAGPVEIPAFQGYTGSYFVDTLVHSQT